MKNKQKPIPKSQLELARESRTSYDLLGQGQPPVVDRKAREYQKTVKDDTTARFKIGIEDIDETIFYYFNKVIQPTVIQNGQILEVPVVYGTPEKWKAVQRDGYYRDNKGKTQIPLIIIKRDSIEKNRKLGNKVDANNPHNLGIFEKPYSRKNAYDHFNIVTNRVAVKEYQGVVIPDYINLTYSCIIFTEYVGQMNKLIEGINYASDTYWGDPGKFSFRAWIDDFTHVVELEQNGERIVKTTFTIKVLGHIVPDNINTQLQGVSKFFSKSAIRFNTEIAGSAEEFGLISSRESTQRATTVRDTIGTPILPNAEVSSEEKIYLTLQKVYTSANTGISLNLETNTITWENITIATPPPGYPALTKDNFQLFINGMAVEIDAIDSITQVGSNVEVVLNANLDFIVDSTDEFILTGKFI